MQPKILVPAAVLLFAAGFAASWFLKPADVRVVESVKTFETRHVVETKQQTVDLDELRKIVAEAATKKNVVTTREVVYLPDGTKTEKTRTEDKSETSTKRVAETSTDVKSSTSTKSDTTSTKSEERIKLVERLSRPDWLITAGAGVGIPTLLGADAPSLVPGLPRQLYVSAGVSRRLIGPIYAGVEATTRGDVGLRLGAVF